MSTGVACAVESTLAPYLDHDTCEYITSLLVDDPSDEEARETVVTLIESGVEESQIDPKSICMSFFQLLDLGYEEKLQNSSSEVIPLRKLMQAVTIKSLDIQNYAMGISAELDLGSQEDNQKESQIAAFYANMIDGNLNLEAVSEKKRRKERQKELRIKLEEEERERAIQEAMSILREPEIGKTVQSMMEASSDNMQDVHFRNFDLPNLRGGGPNLLQNASLTLARGRRYGLMGRNGCGKTTLLSFIASRQLTDAVPKNMNMLLVRQEIIGNDCSAVETVLKSDVKRHSVKQFIQWCEEELDKLQNLEVEPQSLEETKVNIESKSRQKLLERKKQKPTRGAIMQPMNPKLIVAIDEKKVDLNVKLSKAYQRLASIEEEDGGDPEPRARKVLAGLGFSKKMMEKPTHQLSGGWRMRVSLSSALFASPSLLLLDEPTNHLDLEAVLWLEKYLTTQFTGTLVVVSHDRHFLNQVVTDVVHFHQNTLNCYRGDITNFEAVREENRSRQIRLREAQEAKKAQLQKFIDLHSQAGENGVKAARQRKSKMKKLDKIGVMAQEGKRYKASYDGTAEEVEEYKEDEKVELKFPDPGSFNGDIVKLERVSFGYSSDDLLLHQIDLSINAKSRIALLGKNGCGKSTLIKLVVGSLQSSQGKVKVDGRARIEYLAQHQLEQLDPDGTPLETIIDRYPGDRSNTHIGQLRRHLANFGLGGNVLPTQKISTMSGGQKCRLCLACAMYRKPHLLILDEPTNHLDLETTEALIEGILSFQGGVLLVSHDQHLLTSVCEDLVVIRNGKVEVLTVGMTNLEAFHAYKKATLLESGL